MYYNYTICCGERIHKRVPLRGKTYYCRKCKALHKFYRTDKGFTVETYYLSKAHNGEVSPVVQCG